MDDPLVRPLPSRPVGQRAREWLVWFGLGRVVVIGVSVVAVGAGGYWLLRPPAVPVETSLPRASPDSSVTPASNGPGASLPVADVVVDHQHRRRNAHRGPRRRSRRTTGRVHAAARLAGGRRDRRRRAAPRRRRKVMRSTSPNHCATATGSTCRASTTRRACRPASRRQPLRCRARVRSGAPAAAGRPQHGHSRTAGRACRASARRPPRRSSLTAS